MGNSHYKINGTQLDDLYATCPILSDEYSLVDFQNSYKDISNLRYVKGDSTEIWGNEVKGQGKYYIDGSTESAIFASKASSPYITVNSTSQYIPFNFNSTNTYYDKVYFKYIDDGCYYSYTIDFESKTLITNKNGIFLCLVSGGGSGASSAGFTTRHGSSLNYYCLNIGGAGGGGGGTEFIYINLKESKYNDNQAIYVVKIGGGGKSVSSGITSDYPHYGFTYSTTKGNSGESTTLEVTSYESQSSSELLIEIKGGEGGSACTYKTFDDITSTNGTGIGGDGGYTIYNTTILSNYPVKSMFSCSGGKGGNSIARFKYEKYPNGYDGYDVSILPIEFSFFDFSISSRRSVGKYDFGVGGVSSTMPSTSYYSSAGGGGGASLVGGINTSTNEVIGFGCGGKGGDADVWSSNSVTAGVSGKNGCCLILSIK